MDFTKRLNFGNIFLFLFLAIFPFGQIIRFGITQPADVIVGAGALYSIIAKLEKPEVFKYFKHFLIIAAFSWVFGSTLLGMGNFLYGLMYLARLAAYFYFLIYVWNFTKDNKSNQKLLINSLLSVSVISAIFGWIQYFSFPALKPFMIWGWDEHYLRLAGSFLDPTFLGIVIVLGLIISLYRFMNTRGKLYFLISLFLLISLAFTYSRASYLAFFAGLLVIFHYFKKLKYFALIFLGFILIMLILPTEKNHVLSFTRSFSAVARVEDYKITFSIFKKSPVFGIGYNNLCIAYNKYIGIQPFESHACSGSDSSLLLILATTGIVGFIVLIYMFWNISKGLTQNYYFPVLSSSFLAIVVHSLFSNSLVYPWVLGWMIILLAVTV